MATSTAPSDAVLERLLSLHPKRIDLVLDRVERLLAALGHPETKMPPIIHVAGTNGKGSVCAYLRAMLEGSGYRVHVYTSPHLVHFHERIRIAGRLISEEELAATLEECEAANADAPITFFEITPAAVDHQDFLGDTLAAIAMEKSGILKRGAPAIIGPQDEDAKTIIVRRADQLGVPVTIYGEDFHAFEERGRLVYQDTEGLLDLPLPKLAGRHQLA